MKLEITRRRWILSNISLLTSPVSAPDIISSCFYKRGRLKVYIYAETVCCQLTKLTSYFPFSVAVCLEMTGDIASSIDSYAGIASLLVDIQSAKERVLIDWAEHGLYRGSLISLGNKYVSLWISYSNYPFVYSCIFIIGISHRLHRYSESSEYTSASLRRKILHGD